MSKHALCTTIKPEHASKVVRIRQGPIGYNNQVTEPKNDECIISPPTSSELVAKVEYGSIVDELVQAHKSKYFSFVIVSQ